MRSVKGDYVANCLLWLQCETNFGRWPVANGVVERMKEVSDIDGLLCTTPTGAPNTIVFSKKGMLHCGVGGR